MKKLLLYIIICIGVLSCEKYPEPGSEMLEQFRFYTIGENQMAIGGEMLSNPVGVQVDLASLLPDKNIKFYTEFTVKEGGGTISKFKVDSDAEGKMLASWTMGFTSNLQVLEGKIFDAGNNFFAGFTVEANAFFEDQLNVIKNSFLVGIADMVRDTVKQRSMLISGSKMYVKKGSFYEWENINFPFSTNNKELEINSRGEVFAAGWNGNLYITKDWGLTWNDLGKPIPGNPYHYELSISNDDYIWANKWEKGVYCSKDNGLTWSKDSVGLVSQEQLGRVYKFGDSSHMAISHSMGMPVLQTFDAGKTWKPINTPQYSLTMYVTGEGDLIVQNQGGGFTLNKSTDGGKTYRQVFSPNVAFGTTSAHCYDKYGSYYYVLAPGGGVWKTRDFETFTELFTFQLQRNLFIDHNGTIYASGFNYSNATPDPTLVLPLEK